MRSTLGGTLPPRRHLLQQGSVCYCKWASMLFFAQARCCECVRLTLLVTPSPGPYFWFLIEPDQASDINMCLNQLYCPTQLCWTICQPAFDYLVRRVRLRALSPQWRPCSLRRGGATACFMQLGSLDRTAVQGRWACISAPPVFFPMRRLPRWQPATPRAPNAHPSLFAKVFTPTESCSRSGFPASEKWSGAAARGMSRAASGGLSRAATRDESGSGSPTRTAGCRCIENSV